MRPALSLAGDDWLSRFSLNMFPHMLGVLDRAEPVEHSPLVSRSTVLPSSYGETLGAPGFLLFAALYPTYAFPCQRLDC